MGGVIVRISDKVRHPISLKISGIALGFLVLIMFVTLASNWHLGQVNRELAILSKSYIPIDQTMSDVRSHHLAQTLFFERFMASDSKLDFAAISAQAAKFFSDLPNCERKLLSKVTAKLRETYVDVHAREIAMYELMRNCGNLEVADTRLMVEAGLARATANDNAAQVQKFTKLLGEVERLPEAKAILHVTVGKYLAEVKQADPRALAIVREQLEASRRAVGKQASAVLDLVDQYTIDSAAHAGALEQRAFWFNWGITAVAVMFGALCAYFLTRNLVGPVREILTGARAIEQGDLDIDIKVSSADEIALLAQSFNFMVSGLKEKEAIKETFGKYVDPRIVRGLLEKQPLSEGGGKRTMTVLFSDIEGFTTICEQWSPDAVVRLLNHYFSVMSQPIQANLGIIDKYIGDSIMAFWGPPFSGAADHAELACFAALEQMARLDAFRAALPDIIGLRKGMPAFNVRIGLCTGPVIVGTIGSEVTKSYTVIGDAVNLASRLEAANKLFGTSLIISEETRSMAGAAIVTRELDCIYVAGKSEPVRIFELMGRAGQVAPAVLALCERFEAGLQLYRARDWHGALACFEQCMAQQPNDAPSRIFITRLQYLQAHEPPPDWNGVWTVKTPSG
jgi:adenylate cyclase